MPKKLTLDMARKIAKKRHGECLSTEYINSKTPMLWKCHQGHIWSIPFKNIKNRKNWCPTCHSPRKTIDDMRQHARSRKGDCLSDKYYNRDTKLKWICEKSHIWEARPEDVLRGTWCPVCAGNISYTIENAKQIAMESVFQQNISIIVLNCYGNALRVSIKHLGNWCPYCAGNARLTLEDMRTLAQKKGSTKLKWVCKNNHIWEAVFASIQQGTWCPFCSRFTREKLCREIVSKYLGPPSKIRRPDFLKTPEYYQGLELDIPYYDYAIEVQGEQHEKFNKFFHRGDPNNFIKQQERDQLKKELCEENQIALRYVWYYEDPYVVIPEHLRELGLIE